MKASQLQPMHGRPMSTSPAPFPLLPTKSHLQMNYSRSLGWSLGLPLLPSQSTWYSSPKSSLPRLPVLVSPLLKDHDTSPLHNQGSPCRPRCAVLQTMPVGLVGTPSHGSLTRPRPLLSPEVCSCHRSSDAFCSSCTNPHPTSGSRIHSKYSLLTRSLMPTSLPLSCLTTRLSTGSEQCAL